MIDLTYHETVLTQEFKKIATEQMLIRAKLRQMYRSKGLGGKAFTKWGIEHSFKGERKALALSYLKELSWLMGSRLRLTDQLCKTRWYLDRF